MWVSYKTHFMYPHRQQCRYNLQCSLTRSLTLLLACLLGRSVSRARYTCVYIVFIVAAFRCRLFSTIFTACAYYHSTYTSISALYLWPFCFISSRFHRQIFFWSLCTLLLPHIFVSYWVVLSRLFCCCSSCCYCITFPFPLIDHVHISIHLKYAKF